MGAQLTYGGVTLCYATPKLSAWVERNISFADLVEFSAAHWPGTDRLSWSFAAPGPYPKVELGKLYWPRDASRFACGHFLVTDKKLEILRRQVYSAGVNGYGAQDLVMTSGGDTITAKMFMLPPRPLSQFLGFSNTRNGLYLLTLVDERFFWWQQSAAITRKTAR